MTIKFGTDGWRAVVSDTFTFANLRLVAQAIADYVLEEAGYDRPEVIVGFDTRFLSDRYAAEVSCVMAGNNIVTHLTRADAPTPAVSHAVVHKKAVAGVVITASHNPPRYNGLKLKAAFGGTALPGQADRVEAHLVRNQEAACGPNVMEYQLVNLDVISNGELRVVTDAMYGSGRKCIADMLARTRCRVHEIRGEMNPGFGGIHPEPIARYLSALGADIQSYHADLGLATDGDGDRDRLAVRYGLPLVETPVGFNHIADHMLNGDVLIGGEESGGMSIKGHIPEGDGVLMGLLLLEIVSAAGAPLHELVANLQADVGPTCYTRRDIPLRRPVAKAEMVARLTGDVPDALGGQEIVEVKTLDGVQYLLADDSWLLIRPSGTEPVLRVYAEARESGMVKELLSYGEHVAGGQ
jgi:phosphomannomutase